MAEEHRVGVGSGWRETEAAGRLRPDHRDYSECITVNAQGCSELGGEGRNTSVYGGILRRPHHKTRVSSF